MPQGDPELLPPEEPADDGAETAEAAEAPDTTGAGAAGVPPVEAEVLPEGEGPRKRNKIAGWIERRAEKAIKRDLLLVGPKTNEALTTLAALGGYEGEVTALFRVGLPKGEEEVREGVEWELRNGLTTKEQALKRIHPTATPEQIKEMLAELEKERQAEIDAMPEVAVQA